MKDCGVTRYYKVTGGDEGQLNMLEKLFVCLEDLCSVGSSGSFSVFVDGDGALSLEFESHCSDGFVFLPLDYDSVMDSDGGYGRVEVSDDGEFWFDLG